MRVLQDRREFLGEIAEEQLEEGRRERRYGETFYLYVPRHTHTTVQRCLLSNASYVVFCHMA